MARRRQVVRAARRTRTAAATRKTRKTRDARTQREVAAPKPPKRRQCGTMQVHHRLLERDPRFRRAQFDLEGSTRRVMAGMQRGRTGVIKIPVVVHVVYRTKRENISQAQIRSQIAVLNRDYRAKNPDRDKTPTAWAGLVGNSNIEFRLATRDPKGKVTTGVTRTLTTRASFDTDDGVKSKRQGGADPWPSNKYLNIWVCNLGDGLLGYAQFPGGPAKTDGVVILNTAFGTSGIATAPFALGRTTTHEVGHWLNLRHIWGDTEDCSGSDLVADTPNAAMPNYGKPRFPHVTCGNGPYGDMFMNYMDYVDDDAMFMFTYGQAVRMRAALDGPRSTIGRSTKR